VAVFDYRYTTGSGKNQRTNMQTVVVLPSAKGLSFAKTRLLRRRGSGVVAVGVLVESEARGLCWGIVEGPWRNVAPCGDGLPSSNRQ